MLTIFCTVGLPKSEPDAIGVTDRGGVDAALIWEDSIGVTALGGVTGPSWEDSILTSLLWAKFKENLIIIF